MTNQKNYVAGHHGMVGSPIVRHLLAQGVAQSQIVTRTHAEVDLTNQAAVQAFFAVEKPSVPQNLMQAIVDFNTTRKDLIAEEIIWKI